MTNQVTKAVHIVSEMGADMMTLEGFGREGDQLTVQGALMGSWSTKMYISPQDAWKMIGMFLKPQMIGYILGLPLILLRGRLKIASLDHN